MANFLDVSDSEDELDNEVCIGGYRGDIVGIRYYRGTVNNNEMVSLTREPHNPYDRNAVRVDNVYGIQVGHIKRELARALANVMDNGLARFCKMEVNTRCHKKSRKQCLVSPPGGTPI